MKRELLSEFSATVFKLDFSFTNKGEILFICALKVDKIVYCGPSFYNEIHIVLSSQNPIFHTWFKLARRALLEKDAIETIFVLTLVVDGKIQLYYNTTYCLKPSNVNSAF